MEELIGNTTASHHNITPQSTNFVKSYSARFLPTQKPPFKRLQFTELCFYLFMQTSIFFNFTSEFFV